MKFEQVIGRAAELFAIASLCACASTSLDTSWTNSNYDRGPMRKVLVAGISNQASVRRVFEDTFVESLRAAGVEAVASHTLVPEDGKIPADAFKTAVEQAGADAVLITRAIRSETEIRSSPAPIAPPVVVGGAGYYHGYYSTAWGGYYEPDVREYTRVVSETTLFAKDDPQPVWSGTTRTPEARDIRAATEDFAEVIIEALRRDGLI